MFKTAARAGVRACGSLSNYITRFFFSFFFFLRLLCAFPKLLSCLAEQQLFFLRSVCGGGDDDDDVDGIQPILSTYFFLCHQCAATTNSFSSSLFIHSLIRTTSITKKSASNRAGLSLARRPDLNFKYSKKTFVTIIRLHTSHTHTRTYLFSVDDFNIYYYFDCARVLLHFVKSICLKIVSH